MLTVEPCALPEGILVSWNNGTELWAAPICCPLVVAWAVLRLEIDRRARAS